MKSVNIKLDKNWWIKSDSYQYILVEEKETMEGKNKGKKYFDMNHATFYRTLPHLIEDHHHRLVRLSGATTLRELKQAYNSAKESIEQLNKSLGL